MIRNDYAPPDEFGEMPYKQVERMGGYEPISALHPVNRSTFREMVREFVLLHQRKPVKLHTTQKDTGSRVMDCIHKDIGYVCCDVVWESPKAGTATEWLE